MASAGYTHSFHQVVKNITSEALADVRQRLRKLSQRRHTAGVRLQRIVKPSPASLISKVAVSPSCTCPDNTLRAS